MQYFKGQSAPVVQDLQGLLQVFRAKEEVSRAEVDICGILCKEVAGQRGHLPAQARRLLPDPPEQGKADVQ